MVLGVACGTLLAASGAEPAETASPAQPSRYYSRTWQTDDGLPRNTISAIAQTPDGYLWLGTPFGIIRYDGTTFTPMEDQLGGGNPRLRTRALVLDQQGRLWMGTATAGILRWDGEEAKVIGKREIMSVAAVTDICEDFSGKVWVTGGSGRLFRVDENDTVRSLDPLPGPKSLDARLARDGSGGVWFTQGTLYGRLVNGVATNVTRVPGGWAANLCPSRDGGVWIGIGNELHKVHPPEAGLKDQLLALPKVNCGWAPTGKDCFGMLTVSSRGNLTRPTELPRFTRTRNPTCGWARRAEDSADCVPEYSAPFPPSKACRLRCSCQCARTGTEPCGSHRGIGA
jgi:hypothetical protein